MGLQLVLRSYDTIELQRVRSELERRRISVHISDEFTYAIPGMPGAEQPRGLWVDHDDLLPAQRVVADLLGDERVAQPDDDAPATISPDASRNAANPLTSIWPWLSVGLIILALLMLTG